MVPFLEAEAENFLVAVLILPIIYIIIKQIKHSCASNSPPLPPGPTPWPILGNIPHMGSKPHITLANIARIYGPLISLKLGTQCLVIGSSPDAAMEILKTKDRILSGRYVPRSMSELTESSLGWAEECNDYWKYIRTLCKTELFSSQATESQSALRDKNITDLISFVRDSEGVAIRISEPVFATLFNVLGNALMSTDFARLDEKNEDGGLKGAIRGIMEVVAAPNLSDFYPILSKFDLQGLRKKSKDLFLRIQGVWRPVIEERRNRKASVTGHQDFLDILLDNEFSNKQIDQLFTELITAATDTTTSTVEWTMAELLRNPECMRRVREEIEAEIKEDFPKNSHLLQLPYLQACIKETLRLHPPAPLLLPHRAIETCQVMNYTVPKNAQVMINVWAIGRDPSIWEEPLKFKPERFLDSDVDFKGNSFEFLPFSAGRRICPGLPMAAMNVPLILVSLIHCFDWSLPNGNDINGLSMEEKFGVTLQMEHQLLLVPKVR